MGESIHRPGAHRPKRCPGMGASFVPTCANIIGVFTYIYAKQGDKLFEGLKCCKCAKTPCFVGFVGEGGIFRQLEL